MSIESVFFPVSGPLGLLATFILLSSRGKYDQYYAYYVAALVFVAVIQAAIVAYAAHRINGNRKITFLLFIATLYLVCAVAHYVLLIAANTG